MKVKLKTPDRVVVGFSRRELALISNCLSEACNGILMDRFVPAHDELVRMLASVDDINRSQDYFRIKSPVI